MAIRSTSIDPAATHRRVPTRADISSLIPTSASWILGTYFVLPIFLVIVLHDPSSPVSMGEHYLQIMVHVAVVGGSLYAFYAWAIPRLFLRVRSRLGRLVVHACCIIAAVLLGSHLGDAIDVRLGIAMPGRGQIYEALVSTTLVTAFVFVSITYARLQRERREAKKRESEARQAALVAQLQALQLRTNPHFLFNSLNTVASLIGSDPVKAEDTLVRLAGLFRYSLEGSRRPSVALGEELAIIRDYLELEGLRLGQRLKWELDAAEELTEVRLPPLVLQPLVENAIIHGIAPRREGGRIQIRVQAEGDEVVIEVQDDGQGSSNHRGTGTALDDLERRLELSYRGQARIERQFDQAGHRVCIRLPKTLNLEWQ